MSRFPSPAVVFLAASSTLAVAQTFTACDPLNSTACPKDMALGTSHFWDWTSGDAADTAIWNTTAGSIDWTTEGAKFVIKEKGDSPTIQSTFYIFFGQVSVIMTAAKGKGIISSLVLESDVLDEIDWEFLGANTTAVETNYFGKANTSGPDHALQHGVDDPQSHMHNYTTVWTNDSISWFIDGVIARTLDRADAAADGRNFPQTPMVVRLGIWAAGDADEDEGVVEWAGGEVEYGDGPFTMTIHSVYVRDDDSSGASYAYGDRSGTSSSITIASGTSAIAKALANSSTKALQTLPKWANITIAVVVLSMAAVAVAATTVFYLRRRKAGNKARALRQREWEKLQMETLMREQKGVGEEAGEDGGFFSYKGEYREVPTTATVGGVGGGYV